MQQRNLNQLPSGRQRMSRQLHGGSCRRFSVPRPQATVASASNGTGTNGHKAVAHKPSPAETARTIIEICNEGTLCTLAPDGTPIGTPVSFTLTKGGLPCVELHPGSLELQHLTRDQRCSIQLQANQFPARAVASVTLVGRISPDVESPQQTMEVDKCLYVGGLDQGAAEVSSEELLAAEPDVLRKVAVDLVRLWNEERAEDIYRIVSQHLNIPLTEMGYAELLWIDRLGLYARVEAGEHLPGSVVVRVPFYRPVLDERDARSVLTMASQVAWETDRPYTPPVPSIFTDAKAAANN